MPQIAPKPRPTSAAYRWLLVALAVFLVLGLYFLVAGLTLGDTPMREAFMPSTQI